VNLLLREKRINTLSLLCSDFSVRGTACRVEVHQNTVSRFDLQLGKANKGQGHRGKPIDRGCHHARRISRSIGPEYRHRLKADSAGKLSSAQTGPNSYPHQFFLIPELAHPGASTVSGCERALTRRRQSRNGLKNSIDLQKIVRERCCENMEAFKPSSRRA
jgi:hypothetical protein